LKPEFRTEQRDGYWVVEIFYTTDGSQPQLFSDWGFEEPFPENVYQMMSNWCYEHFKTWLKPRRARRMSYNQFWFKSKKDLDWFMLYWSGVDISVD